MVSCGHLYTHHEHREYRQALELRRLAGQSAAIFSSSPASPDQVGCMDNFEDFIATLSIIHINGDDECLNGHVKPQHLGCFKYHLPAEWDDFKQLEEPDAAWALAAHLGDDSKPSFPHENAGSSAPLKITAELDEIMNR